MWTLLLYGVRGCLHVCLCPVILSSLNNFVLQLLSSTLGFCFRSFSISTNINLDKQLLYLILCLMPQMFWLFFVFCYYSSSISSLLFFCFVEFLFNISKEDIIHTRTHSLYTTNISTILFPVPQYYTHQEQQQQQQQ